MKLLYLIILISFSSLNAQQSLLESARKIPLVYDVDVIVIGGNTSGIAAAIEASKSGARVFLAARRPFLGNNLCGSGFTWVDQEEKIQTSLGKAIYQTDTQEKTKSDVNVQSKIIYPRPMHIKSVLDQALLAANVEFLYGCFATELLIDEAGNASGIVMANKSGRQAVKAKVIIDATERAWFARLAGAHFRPYPSSPQIFKRVTLGGRPAKGALKLPYKRTWNQKKGKKTKHLEAQLWQHKLKYMADGSYKSLIEIEQKAKNATWQEGQLSASDVLLQLPPDNLISAQTDTVNFAVSSLNILSFIPDNKKYILISGPAADITRAAAENIMKVDNSIKLGMKIGKHAAILADQRSSIKEVLVAGTVSEGKHCGEVKEFLNGLRGEIKSAKKFIKSPTRDLKILAHYDTVVIGGGTGGAPAAIAASRHGAKTLLVEFHHGLGGIGTMGLIGTYWYGNRVGFTREIDHITNHGRRSWNVQKKMEWYRSTFIKAGGTLWTGAIGCGVLVDNSRVTGVIVATPEGRGVVLCNSVIDSTGNADIAIAAGAEYEYINSKTFGMQGSGLPFANLGNNYTNSDWTFIDDMDMLDRKRAHVVAKLKFKHEWDLAQHIDSRERRHIIGEYYLTPLDIARQKTFHDNIVLSKSNWDSHGYSNHLLFKFWFPGLKEVNSTYLPYRSLQAKGIDGILVTGTGISAHRDSFPIIRMQADVQNHGYAAGIATAIAAQDKTSVKKISIKKLQKKLVQKGILEITAAGQKDSSQTNITAVNKAIANLKDNFKGVWSILDAPRHISIAQLKKALHDPAKALRAAHILAYFKDSSGKDLLLDFLKTHEWDKGWRMQGMGNHGSGYSRLDSIIIGLAQAGVQEATPLIIQKLQELNHHSAFSHVRSCALALEKLNNPTGAKALAAFLNKKGITNNELLTYNDVIKKTPAYINDTKERRASLRELILARALYNCGDIDDLGRTILMNYSNDLRGVYALHARKVLAAKAH